MNTDRWRDMVSASRQSIIHPQRGWRLLKSHNSFNLASSSGLGPRRNNISIMGRLALGDIGLKSPIPSSLLFLIHHTRLQTVPSTVPTNADRDTELLKRVFREYLFDLTITIAFNALVGRRVSGFGLVKVKETGSHSDWRTGQEDTTSPSLIQELEELGLKNTVGIHVTTASTAD
jgi:hypothetical protein